MIKEDGTYEMPDAARAKCKVGVVVSNHERQQDGPRHDDGREAERCQELRPVPRWLRR